MKEHFKKYFGTFFTFIIGVTIGTGGFWQYQQLQFEKTKLAYEIGKDIYEFRTKIVEKQQQVSEINSSVNRLLPKESKNWDSLQKLYKLKNDFLDEIRFLKTEIEKQEERLASIENREIRKMDFDSPAAPSISITVN